MQYIYAYLLSVCLSLIFSLFSFSLISSLHSHQLQLLQAYTHSTFTHKTTLFYLSYILGIFQQKHCELLMDVTSYVHGCLWTKRRYVKYNIPYDIISIYIYSSPLSLCINQELFIERQQRIQQILLIFIANQALGIRLTMQLISASSGTLSYRYATA